MGRETDRLSRKMRGSINVVSRRLVLDVSRRLGESTPIATGWARSNWIPSKGQPVEVASGDRQNVTLAGLVAGIGEIAVWDLFQESAFITNNVPYIRKLNAGSSPQAQSGFVPVSIEAGIAGLNNAVLR